VQAIIVGGGMIGVASAYYLQRRGIDVAVVERSRIGAGNTGRANGGIRAQFSSPVSSALSQASMSVWERFGTEFDVDIGYRRPGYLFLAREESTAEQFRENVERQNEVGVPSEYITAEEAAERCPGLYEERFIGATYSPTDGFADPNLGLRGFAEQARKEGVDVRTNTEVLDVLQESGRVVGVETTERAMSCEVVVNAAGAWAGQVGRMVGLDLPISPRRRKLAIVDPEKPVPETVPFTIDGDEGVHFRPEREGAAVAGGHFAAEDPEEDPSDFEKRTSIDWAARVVEKAADVAEYFGPDTGIRRGWAGVYAVTPDHHPIIEETVPGFVNAIGFSGHGFMQSPATGQLVAEIVADGTPSLVDISALGANRFERGAHLEEGTVID
jgi:sarcosine oxidase subunit beta